MSNKYIVDTDAVDKAVEDLKKLQEDCLEYYNMKMPESSHDMGQTHNEIQLLHENLKDNWKKFDELISKTIEFLGKDSETVITSDKTSADALKGETTETSTSNTSRDNSNNVSEGAEVGTGVGVGVGVGASVTAGQVLTDVNPYSPKVSPNGFTNYNGKGNCTWYVDNRWSQKNPDYPLVFTENSGRDAKYWADKIDKSKFNVLSTADPNNLQGNAIAVSQSGSYGHVAYIEEVKDGNVYYTEDGESYTRPHTWEYDTSGNAVGPKVQCCTLAEFKNKFNSIITIK